MDRLTRKQLKQDKFAMEVGQGLEYLSTHKQQVKLYGGIALFALIAIASYWIYSTRQEVARAEALAQAIHVNDAVIGPAPQGPNMNFNTQAEKDKAVIDAYTKVATQYRGTQEGAIAGLRLAAYQMDRNEQDAAIKLYQDLMESAPEAYAAVAKMALAEVYAGQDKLAEAEKLLRELIKDPTPFISAEEATLTLAKVLTPSRPEDARKMLEPLRNSRSAVSRVAVQLLGELPPAPATSTPAKAN
jgi:predicted negative regulator of RcsB-dependent stress response